MTELTHLNCEPCHKGSSQLADLEITELCEQIPKWAVLEFDEIKRLQRVFKFEDFAKALRFTDRIGELAEAHDHHPTLLTEWGRVTVTWWTHAVHGLHPNDFIMAAKTDELYGEN